MPKKAIPRPSPDPAAAAAVLSRVEEVVGARSAADLARALGVQVQTVYSWRKRRVIPFDALVRLAVERDVPLDYVILGRGPSWTASGSVIPQLLIEIGNELVAQWAVGKMDELPPGSPAFLNFTAQIYNRVVGRGGQTGSPYPFIKEEVAQLILHLSIDAELRPRPASPVGR